MRFFKNMAKVFPTNYQENITSKAIEMVFAYSFFVAIVPLNIKTCNLSQIRSLICLTMYFIDGYFSFYYMRETFHFEVNKMLAFLVPKAFRTIETFLQMVMYTMILNTHFFLNSKLKNILNDIEQVDKQLSLVQNLKPNVLDLRLKQKIHIFFIFFFISSFLAMAFRHLTQSPYSATAIFGFFMPHFQPYAITAQFIILLDVQSNRFEVINMHIKNLKHTYKNKKLSLTTLEQLKSDLNILACTHNDLCGSCIRINHYFDVQILLAVACHFLSVSVAAYTFLSSIGFLFQNEVITPLSIILLVCHSCIWLAQRFAILTLTAQATTRAETLSRDTHQISHKLLIKEHVPELSHDLELFTSNVEKHEVEFSACGFFPIDYSMIYMIIGAATTYWVILVQLQTSAFTNTNNSTTTKPTPETLVNAMFNNKKSTFNYTTSNFTKEH